jgi:hypothetical protein
MQVSAECAGFAVGIDHATQIEHEIRALHYLANVAQRGFPVVHAEVKRLFVMKRGSGRVTRLVGWAWEWPWGLMIRGATEHEQEGPR